MMTIVVVSALPLPRFRVLGADAVPVALATLTVVDARSGTVCWSIAPEGSVVTSGGSESEALEIRGPKVASLGANASEVSYGTTPTGLTQFFPEGRSPTPLVPGRIYVVSVSGAGASTGDGAAADFEVV